MDEERINLLAEKWRNGTLTDVERQEFELWYASFDDQEKVMLDGEDPKALGERMYAHILRERSRMLNTSTRRVISWRRVAAAAILIGILASTYIWFRWQNPAGELAVEYKSGQGNNDLPPGGDRATLTLGDGTIIPLDEIQEGRLAEHVGVSFIKPDNGSLDYATIKNTNQSTYNTLSTPRGGQFRLILPDSSVVYLNAASSITFLTAFDGKERRVDITGEAYFEVRPDKTKPFRVYMTGADGKGQVIEVLGTHFNINAYADEGVVRTSLLEGSVKIIPVTGTGEIAKKDAGLLKPGQQSVLQYGVLRVQEADVLSAVAWKNGLFQFREASLPEVMRQLSRWYDVDIVYEGPVSERKFSGKMYRNINASQALEILKFMKVNFRIEGKKIIVTP